MNVSTIFVSRHSHSRIHFFVLGFAAVLALLLMPEVVRGQTDQVSFHRDVRPILQAHCYGCHQGAAKKGNYVMTRFEQLLAGGESGIESIVAGDAESSYLVELITPTENEAGDHVAAMPPNEPPLAKEQIDLISRWIDQGAINDSPERVVFDQQNPPTYSRLPVVTSVAYAPDGKLLAISGVNEVILVDTQDTSSRRRLIGLSPRIEDIQFSPDGTKLAVAAGTPGEFGEIQIWDAETGDQLLSKTVTHDTIYGVSWSPDGKTIAFGCADTSIRGINASDGVQVLFQNAHEDWIRDTVFSVDGSHLVSVGRDMTCKLTEVAEQRFVDNITSITPGVLKGGIASVARHPQRDEVVIGGADGIAKVYRMHRLTKRVIGDDANLVRKMPKMLGRIQAVAVSNDGKRFVAGSSLSGQGAIAVYSYEFDPTLPDDIKGIMSRVVTQRSAEEKSKLEEYVTRDVKVIASKEFETTGVFAVDFHPDNNRIVLAGSDGMVRIMQTETGELIDEFPSVDVQKSEVNAEQDVEPLAHISETADSSTQSESPALPDSIDEITIEPAHIEIARDNDYAQVIVTAHLSDGQQIDVTRAATFEFDESQFSLSPSGLLQPIAIGDSSLSVDVAGKKAKATVSVKGASVQYDFAHDIQPVLSRLGCNAGTCHGSAQGKNGFQLSLRGYDSVADIRAFTDDMGSRRVNVAAPAESLMILKATAAVPHEGGQVVVPNSKYHQMIQKWIEQGARFDVSSPRVQSIEVIPPNPVMQALGSTQQMRVVATYSDGSLRDVSREAFVESADAEIAGANDSGLITAVRRGEAAIIARFEGAFAATTLTVMGDRSGFVWHEPNSFNEIDNFVADKWQRMKIQPSELTSDEEFLRRIYLDLTGLPPTAEQVRSFIADPAETQAKRQAVIDSLIGNEAFVDHWTNKWADLLQVNRKYLGAEGAVSFRDWIRGQVHDNVPYDQFVRSIITADGSNKEHPAASYYKILRTPDAIMENTTHLFLATRFNCNKCHDHPFERWTQDQYYETAAFFARVGLKKDPNSGDKRIAGTAVESAKPLYEIIYEMPEGEMTHDRTGEVTDPAFPYETEYAAVESTDRRVEFASWLTSPGNPYFARSYVNRLWGYLMGRGLIEPIDDIRASNPPTNPELLDYLTSEFVGSGFDVRHVIRLICSSRVYQLSIKTNEFNVDDTINYSHAIPRRLPAEVLYDAIHFAVGSQSSIPGQQPGTRASALPDAGVKLPSGFLTTLGRPPRESVCECDRVNDIQLTSVLALVSGPDQARAINDPDNAIAKLAAEFSDDQELIRELYLRILNRHASDLEIELAMEIFQLIESDHEDLVGSHQARKDHVAKILPDLERKREEAIAAAKSDLDQFIESTDPTLLQREEERKQTIASLERDEKVFNDSIDERIQQWRTQEISRVNWMPIVPSNIASSNGSMLDYQSDRSIFIKENKGKGHVELVFDPAGKPVTAFRFEALSDERLPEKGPGLAPNGNFVLSEFQIFRIPKDHPDKPVAIAAQTAAADFEQQFYPITKTYDGKTTGGNSEGWAIVPEVGKSHWVTYQLKEPINPGDGDKIRVLVHMNYDDNHQIGRFRVSVTDATEPVGLSTSEETLELLVDGANNEESKKTLTELLRKSDPNWLGLQKRLVEARKPLKIDPGIVQRRAKLERVSKPLPPDPKLVQLEQDLKYSQQQVNQKRVTAAQDIAWALINSPSFLFNR